MIPFSFEKVRTEQDAIQAAAAGGRYIAGGTTLIDLMREEVERPKRLIDINALPLSDVRVEGSDLVIGALALARSMVVVFGSSPFPLLVEDPFDKLRGEQDRQRG